MSYLIKFLESLLLLPGIFVVLLFAIGGFCLRHRRKVVGLSVLGVALLVYASSTSLFAYALIRPLEQQWYNPPIHPQGDVIIMLGGGATFGTPAVSGAGNLTGDGANRLLTTAMLFRNTRLPILLTSGPMQDGTSQSLIAKQSLEALGVPQADILTENNSLDTVENAKLSKPILQRNGYSHPILVTSAYHMPRAVLDFKQVGIKVTPYPCGYYANEGVAEGYDRLFPSTGSLMTTETAIHEYAGILAARLKLKG